MRVGEWTLRSRRVVTSSGTRAADILIRNEMIAAVLAYEDPDAEGVILDAGDLAVLPGLIALHGDGPGALDGRWFDAVTRVCGAGGVTTLVDLPPRPDIDHADPSASFKRMAAAKGKIRVDCGLVVPLGHGHLDQIESWIEAGFIGVEAIPGQGVRGSGGLSTEADLRAAMPILAELGRPLIVDSGQIGRFPGPSADVEPFGSRLPDRELAAIRLVIRLCRETRCRVHLIRPSASESLPIIADARAEGLPITAETCPTHLGLTTRELLEGMATLPFEPARRGFEDRNRLWVALESGLIDSIGPDVPGFSTNPRNRPIDAQSSAPDEPISLRLALPAVWAEAHRRGFTLDHLGRWLATRTAQVLGLAGRKGAIAPGLDADFVLFDSEAPVLVEDPFLAGQVEATILRGTLIYHSGQFFEHPRGAVVLRFEETQPILGTDA